MNKLLRKERLNFAIEIACRRLWDDQFHLLKIKINKIKTKLKHFKVMNEIKKTII